MLVFSSQTGELLTIFQDEGYLTDSRTAAAGAVAAKYLAPPAIECIGVIGAGLQARLQLEYLREVTNCRCVKLWARSAERARRGRGGRLRDRGVRFAGEGGRGRAVGGDDHGIP